MEGTWREMYRRVRRWYTRLSESDAIDDRRVDDFYAFFACCYHLKDWLKNDRSVDRSVRDAVERFINESSCLSLCADVANGAKHLVLSRPRVDPSARVEQVEGAFQADAFQSDAFQVDQILIVAEGRTYDALQLADECVRTWDEFLKQGRLIQTT